MSSQTSNFGAPAGPPSSFLQALSEGMHAMVQPLTVAQANLETILFNGMTLEEYKQATEDSLSSMSRGMELLGYVRELIRIYGTADTVTPVPVAAAIDTAVEDLRQVFDDKQVQVSLSIADRGIAVLGSPERLRQAFFYILQAAYSCANAGDVVSLHVVRLPGGKLAEAAVEIATPTREKQPTIGVTTPEAPAKDAVAQPVQAQIARSLALAEAIVIRQRGEFECVMAPFGVRLRFPITHGGNEDRIISQLPPWQA